MRYRRFGRTGLEVSELVFGGGWVGGVLINQEVQTKLATLRRAMQAGIDGLEGRRTDALAGFRQAIRELDEIGAVLDGVYTAIDMAATLGPSEPEVQTQTDRARATLERLRATALLDRLDAVRGHVAPVRDDVHDRRSRLRRER